MARKNNERRSKGGMTIRDVEINYDVSFNAPPNKKFITHLKDQGLEPLANIWKKLDRKK